MAETILEWTLIAVDKASDKLKNVGDELDKSAGKFDKYKALGVAAMAAVGLAVGKFASDSINAYQESEQAQADMQSAFERFPGLADTNIAAFNALNQQLQRNTTFGDEAASSAETMLAQFDLTGTQIQQLMPLVADFAAKTGQDLPTAAESVGKAFLGNTRALKSVGIEFTSTGDRATDFAAITDALNAKVGGFAETMGDTAAGKAKIMANQIDDLQEKFGALLMPALEGVVDAGTKVLTWMNDNPAAFQALVGVVGFLTVAFIGLTVATWAMNTALLANPITWIVLAIVAAVGLLVAAIVWVASNWDAVWGAISGAISAVWNNVIKPVFDAIGAVFQWIYNNIIAPIVTGIMIYIGLWAAMFQWLWDVAINPALQAIGAGLNWLYTNVFAPVGQFIGDAMRNIGNVFGFVYANAIKPALDGIGQAMQWVWNTIINPVIQAIGNAFQWAGNIMRGAFQGIGDFFRSAFTAALDAVRGPVNGIIGLINGAINGLNSLRVKIPSWVPMVGGQTFGLSLPKLPYLATGGDVISGGFAVVGERGPELVNLPSGASVISNAQSAGALSGAGVNVTVNVTAGAVGDKDDLSKAVVDAIVNGLKRGVVSRGELQTSLGV